MSCQNSNGESIETDHTHEPSPVRALQFTPAGEITGLASALTYAAWMLTAFTGAQPQVEEFVASLSGHGVTGEAIAAGFLASEAQANAADAWERAYLALARQTGVAEAYAAVPGAGTREFLTSE